MHRSGNNANFLEPYVAQNGGRDMACGKIFLLERNRANVLNQRRSIFDSFNRITQANARGKTFGLGVFKKRINFNRHKTEGL